MKRVFFVVGPTATGKSDLAADAAAIVNAEIVNADAFQIYEGLDLLTAKPDATTLAKVPHHLLGTTPVSEEMNAEKFRQAAESTIEKIEARNKTALVVGGSGLYIKSLTHGLSKAPSADRQLREQLNRLEMDELRARLTRLDPATASKIDTKNRRRLTRAIEICLLTAKPISAVVAGAGGPEGGPGSPTTATAATGVFVFRERDELYDRINRRVEKMFEDGVVEEVRAARYVGVTAAMTIGFREIQELLAGKVSLGQCIEAIQQATRRYAKRQLTWFRRQTNFEPLNLSHLKYDEAVEKVSQRALARLRRDD